MKPCNKTSLYADVTTRIIAIPPQQAFFEQINFYRTAFHELSHWTGHKSRLDREFTGQFASLAALARAAELIDRKLKLDLT